MTTIEDSEKFHQGLDKYDEMLESDLQEAQEIIHSKALWALEKILMPLDLELESDVITSLQENVLDKHVDIFSQSNRMEYHDRFKKLREFFGYSPESKEFDLKDVKYGETRAGNPIFLFEAERIYEVENLVTNEIEEAFSAYTPLVVEIDEHIILQWFSKLVKPEKDIRNMVPNNEKEKILQRAKNFGRYLNIVDDYKRGYLPEY
jgi:hypothetical protein